MMGQAAALTGETKAEKECYSKRYCAGHPTHCGQMIFHSPNGFSYLVNGGGEFKLTDVTIMEMPEGIMRHMARCLYRLKAGEAAVNPLHEHARWLCINPDCAKCNWKNKRGKCKRVR